MVKIYQDNPEYEYFKLNPESKTLGLNKLFTGSPKTMKKQYLNFRVFVAFFLFAFFFPAFYSYLGSSGAILINGLLIVFIGVYFLSLNFQVISFENDRQRNLFLRLSFVFIVFLFHIPLSIFIGILFGDVNLIDRDLFELHRPFLYFLIFTLAFITFSSTDLIFEFEKALFVIFILIVLFGLNHFLRFEDLISELYTKSHNINTSRVSVPFVNPYDYAFIMSFFVFYFFSKLLFSNKWFIIPFLISLVMLILPQSRSVIAGFLIGFFIILPLVLTVLTFNFKYLKMSPQLLTFLIVFIAIIMLFLAVIPYLLENFGYLTGQFVKISEGGGVGSSAEIRIGQFLFALEKALSNPLIMIFGNGPAKDELEYVESIYNYQFYRYGLLGFFLYFVFPLFLSIFYLWRILKVRGTKFNGYALFFALLVWFLVIPLLSIGNNFTEQVRNSFFYYSLLGLISASYYLFVLKR